MSRLKVEIDSADGGWVYFTIGDLHKAMVVNDTESITEFVQHVVDYAYTKGTRDQQTVVEQMVLKMLRGDE